MFLPSRRPKDTYRVLLKYALVMAVLTVVLKVFLAIGELANQDIEPFSLERHPYVAPGQTDSRSPCPALNTLANHGFLAHSGRGITHSDYIRALREGYNLSLPFATLLIFGGHILLSQYSMVSLSDLSRHNYIEHNASLGHADAVGDQEYAPCKASPELLSQCLNESSDGLVMTYQDFAAARIRREKAYSHPLDALHEEIARGEMSMVLGIFGRQNATVPIPWIRDWWLDERFPDDFVPDHQQTLFDALRGSFKIRLLMSELRAKAALEESMHHLSL